MEINNQSLYSRVVELLAQSRQKVSQTINNIMATTYFEIGRMIVEEEQDGKEKAEYGKRVLKELSRKLVAEFGKGFSETNLRQIRNFYLLYSIQQTVSAEFKNEELPIQYLVNL